MIAQNPERRYGFKFLHLVDPGNIKPFYVGPFSSYTKYSLPENGRPGLWSRKEAVRLCHRGWHFFLGTRRQRFSSSWQKEKWLRKQWFLVEVEGPFKDGTCLGTRGKSVGTRMRFIMPLERNAAGRLKTLGQYVAEAKKAGLL